jgi:hypothetical protein
MILYSKESVLKTFLEYVFGSTSFRYETNVMGDVELLFAYKDKTTMGIFDRAIVMYQDDNSFHPVLYIHDNKIINPDGEIIFEGLSLTQSFYGWTIHILEQYNSFSLNFYTNDGNNVTEGPIMEWDSKKKMFKLHMPDRSQW